MSDQRRRLDRRRPPLRAAGGLRRRDASREHRRPDRRRPEDAVAGHRHPRHRRRPAADAARNRPRRMARRSRRAAAGERCTRHAERPGAVGRAAVHRRRATARRHRRLRRAHVPLRDRRGGGDPVRAAGRALAGALPAARVRRGAEGRRPRHDPSRDAPFFAADAKDRTALAAAEARGQVVRAWGVESVDVPCPAQIAATDDPRASWYQDYASSTAAVA